MTRHVIITLLGAVVVDYKINSKEDYYTFQKNFQQLYVVTLWHLDRQVNHCPRVLGNLYFVYAPDCPVVNL